MARFRPLPLGRSASVTICTEHLTCAIDARLRDANKRFDAAIRSLKYDHPLFALAA